MSAEPAAFLLAAACGAGMLLFWDVLHGIRCSFARGIVSNIVLDIIWWFVSVSAFLWCAWETVSLRLRFFELFAIAVGAFLYHFTASRWVRRFFCGVFELILKIIKFIFKILLTPALFLDKILTGLFKKHRALRAKRG